MATADSPARGRSAARLIGTAAAVALGLVLLVAVWGKAINPAAFVEQVQMEGLATTAAGATAVAYVALALEAGLGLALVTGVRRLWVLLPAAGLAVFFLFLTGRAYWRYSQGLLEEGVACGCFGNLLSRTPAEAFWQDLALLAPAAVLMFLGRPREGGAPRRRAALAAAAAAAAVLLAWRAPNLPLDDLATRLRPGVEVAALCAGGDGPEAICLDALVPELDGGEHLVVLSGLEEPAFLAALDGLNARVLEPGEERLWVVTAAPPEQVKSFEWTRAPAFEVREAPVQLLRPLYRELPRSFRVSAGRVVATYRGLPPSPENAIGGTEANPDKTRT